MSDDNGTSSIAMFVLQIRKAMSEEKISVTLPQNWIIPVLCALESAQAEIAQLSEARRVVPNLTDEEREELRDLVGGPSTAGEEIEEWFTEKWYRRLPASRVLKDGEVGVDREAVAATSKALDALVVTSWARGDHEEKAITALCLAFQPIALAAKQSAQAKGVEG